MKLFHKILFIFGCLLGSLLQSCSEEFDYSKGIMDIPEGTILLNFAIPDPIRVSTRADVDESVIKNLDVYIFPDNSSQVYHTKYSDIVGNSVGISLGADARDKNVTIYAVANVNNLEDFTQQQDLINKVISSSDIQNGVLPMIGKQTVNTANNNSATVSLYRNMAKITAECSVSGVSVKDLYIYRYSEDAYLGSPIDNNKIKSDNISSSRIENTSEALAYTFPSKGVTKDNMNQGAFVVVGFNRNGKPQYYRLNLRKATAASDEMEYIDLLPNYWYQIKVTGFFTEGYPSPDEAAKHPDCDFNLTYEIHDHALEVLSMITDGYNELGVTPEITFNSSLDTKTVIVKVFSPDNNNISPDEINVEKSDWLSVVRTNDPHDPEDKDFDKDLDHNLNPYYDNDNPGNQFEYTVSISGGENYNGEDGLITFSWNGLSRTVKVNFQAVFLLRDVCAPTLTIIDTDESKEYEITKYWNFITGVGTEKTRSGEAPVLYGIKPENMTNSKKRINGFHFPMPYGKRYNSDPWKYVYTIDFSPMLELPDIKSKNTTISTVSAEISGESFITSNVQWDYTGENKGTLQLTGGYTSYEYAGGKIVFTISYANGSSSTVEASLYHTGFFHFEGEEEYAPSDDFGYYYYEVVPMGEEGDYWLDRNIGAKANTSFIDIEQPGVDRSSAGRLYSIGSPRTFGFDPAYDFSPDFDFGMCPPGYHIPNSTEWDNLRLSDHFKTQSVIFNRTMYMSTYYECDKEKIGNIYLQKARFYNEPSANETDTKYTDEPNAGDAGAGYYWSVTTAPAMEKEQIAAWLRALYLNGSSSTYTNASITDHRMPIRCKAGNSESATEAQEYYISLNVHNVTHVYLFDKETKKALYTFPGKAVGTTASASKWQHFYCSTTVKPETLLTLFIKLEEDGKVTIYRKDGNSFKATTSFNKNFLSEDFAWDIENGRYYDFCETAEDLDARPKNVLDSEPSDCVTDDGSGGNTGGGGSDNKELITGSYTWTGSVEAKWDGNYAFRVFAYGTYDWNNTPEGTKIKIYYNRTGTMNIKIVNSNWGNLNGIQSEYTDWQYPQPSNPIEITLNQTALNDLRMNDNGGFIIQGEGIILTKVEIIWP